MIHILHNYISVADVDHSACGKCFHEPESYWTEWELKNKDKYPKGYCPHSVQVCKCGKWKSFGSHGAMTGLWSGCHKQVLSMVDKGIKVRKYRDFDIFIGEED